jgi:hypothetical protein
VEVAAHGRNFVFKSVSRLPPHPPVAAATGEWVPPAEVAHSSVVSS